MERSWTFTRKFTIGLVLGVAAIVAVAALGFASLQALLSSHHRVDEAHEHLDEVVGAVAALGACQHHVLAAATFGGDEEMSRASASIERATAATAVIDRLEDDPQAGTAARGLHDLLRGELTDLAAILRLRRESGQEAALARYREEHAVIDRAERLEAELVTVLEQRLLASMQESAHRAKRSQRAMVIGAAVVGLLLALGGWRLARALRGQVGGAVSNISSASTELQAAATQQAAGSREQATATTEVTTTMKELLASARQISESAQRVARIAEQTALASRGGRTTVDQAAEAIASIRRQVDRIVEHMVDLGRKSQQIGSVLEIIGELAEQTNILAINATIESAGAGEAGRRFGVVADEIRNLADRVGASAKEIRPLIEDIRSTANAAVMATEDGSKAVDAGGRRFAEVATTFTGIAEAVSTTSEAAREIELSTKQQSTAVEQVNQAVASVAVAAKQMESSTGQTFQASSQLAGLAKDLSRLVTPA